jgi:hypothetical protein
MVGIRPIFNEKYNLNSDFSEKKSECKIFQKKNQSVMNENLQYGEDG